MVALERGAELKVMLTMPFLVGIKESDDDTLRKAVKDSSQWLAFDDTSDYLKALPIEKQDIFKRATY